MILKRRNPGRLLTSLLVLMPFSALLWAQVANLQNHPAGNGGDTNSRTYHLFPDNENNSITRADGTPLKNSEVVDQFGPDASLYIEIDGSPVYGTGGLGWDLLTDNDGISDADWIDPGFPGVNQIKVDVTRGRIKSNPSLNFKYAMDQAAGYTLSGYDDSKEKFILIESLDGNSETNAETIGMVVYYSTDTSSYKYFHFSIQPTDATNIISSNTADNGVLVTAESSLSSSTCYDARSAKSGSGTTAAFVVHCGSSLYTWQINQGAVSGAAIAATDTVAGVSSNVLANDGTHDTSEKKARLRIFDLDYLADTLHVVYTDSSSRVQLRTGLATTSPLYITNTDLNAGTFTSVFNYDANNSSTPNRGPSISCNSTNCFAVWTQNVTKSAPSYDYYLVGRRFGTGYTTGGGDIGGRRVNDEILTPPSATEVQYTNTNRAMVGFTFQRIFTGSEGEELPYLANAVTYYKGRTNCTINDDGTNLVAPRSCWPNRHIPDNGGPSGAANRFLSRPENISNVRELFFFANHFTGAVRDNYASKLMAMWTQPRNSSELFPTSAANRIYYKLWNYEQLNFQSQYPEFSSELIVGDGNGEITSLKFSYTSANNGMLTYIQDNRPHLKAFNGSLFGEDIDFALSGSSKVTALGHSNSIYPSAQTSGGVNEGRLLLAWIEDGKLFTRAYYDNINILVRYYPQLFGPVLTPKGEKTTLLKNNYIKPGNRKPVYIHINNRKQSDKITIKVYTLTGRLVKVLKRGETLSGFQQPVEWHRKNKSGREVASGVYRVVVEGGGRTESGLVIIVR